MNFSVRLENLLEETNITQKRLAMDLHIASSTVNGYINSYREPDFGMLIRLAHYFDVSADYLLGLSEEKKPAPSALDANESMLIRIYRSLVPERRELLIEQAKFYSGLPEKHEEPGSFRGTRQG